MESENIENVEIEAFSRDDIQVSEYAENDQKEADQPQDPPSENNGEMAQASIDSAQDDGEEPLPKSADEDSPEVKSNGKRRRERRKKTRERIYREALETKAQVESLKKRLEKYEELDLSSAENYEEALTSNAVNRALRSRDEFELSEAEKRLEEAQKLQQQEIVQSFNASAQDFAKNAGIDDFEEKVYNNTKLEWPEHAVSMIMNDSFVENGPAVAYHLSRNPELLNSLSGLSREETALAIGQLSGKLSSNTARERQPRRKTSAPPPVKSLNGAGAVPKVDLADPNLSYAEYVKARSKIN